MIRIIMFRQDGSKEWTEGVLHTFSGTNAVVETKATGELNLIPVTPETLKFQVLTEGWIRMQMEAQQRAQSQSVVAPPPSVFRR